VNPPAPDFRNVNTLWASVLVETLVRLGLRQAVVSPGSRSTPLVVALARHPEIEAVPVLDERSAGFFALGLARQRGLPVLLVCTSGTAGAHYFPAVIEARESGAPLLIITADRPPELRDCASGQTIDQHRLYGAYPNHFHELALPEAGEGMLRYLRQTVAHAFSRALGAPAGPVHLNAPFRDPLAPEDDGGATEKAAGALDWASFFGALRAREPSGVSPGAPSFPGAGRGVIVVGPAQPADPEGFAAAVGKIAAKLGWPVLTDGLSPVRGHSGLFPCLVTAYDAILRNPEAARQLRPDQVLCLGGWPTSKVLRGWLEAAAPLTWLVSGLPDNRDALHGRTQALLASPEGLAAALDNQPGPGDYRLLWAAFEGRVRAALDGFLEAEAGLFEPKAAWLLGRHLPPSTTLVVANSMPVRDVEYVWPANDRRIRPFSSRGANGIDGTLSTALGAAHGGGPAVLLTGDLALLHDTNGFLLRPRFRGSLTIVAINNRGGGIFEHLPMSRFDPPFEEFFATPQDVDFARLASAYGVGHVLVRDWAHFVELVATLPAEGVRLLEVRTNRRTDAAGRKRLFAAAAASAAV
jgi:2-succinyl-5-enolpyruvyl-6-hydroxy-3-cyclohexene-1-carboxylate synthase